MSESLPYKIKQSMVASIFTPEKAGKGEKVEIALAATDNAL